MNISLSVITGHQRPVQREPVPSVFVASGVDTGAEPLQYGERRGKGYLVF